MADSETKKDSDLEYTRAKERFLRQAEYAAGIKNKLGDEDVIKLRLDQERQEYMARLEAEQEERESVPRNSSGMSWLLFLPLLIMCAASDILDVFTAGTIGWVAGLFVDGVLLLAVGLNKAGRKQFKRILVGALGDSIPIIAFLPLRSIFLIWAFIKSRNETAQRVSNITRV